MYVKEIMSKHPERIEPASSVTEAAKIMQQYDVGILPVGNDKKIIGMITDRDIVIRVLANNQDPQSTRVQDVMSKDVFCCSPDDTLEKAAQMMEGNKVHRLLVCDGNKNVGVVSVSDFAFKGHQDLLAGEMLEKICEPVGA